MINGRFRLRGGTAAEAAAANPVLNPRELAVETDTGKFKIGDGLRAWNDLPYAQNTGGAGGGLEAFEFSQPTPLDTWTINHNLGRKPIVSVCSLGGMEVGAEVNHLSINTTQVVFAAPQTGFARLI